MQTEKIQYEEKEVKLHRDIAAGVMAGELFRSGYFGKDTEVFGAVCAKEGKTALLYGFDAISVALKAYDSFKDGAEIIALPRKSYHLEMADDEKSVADKFLQYAAETAGTDIDAAQLLEEDCSAKNLWAGFAYEQNGERKTFINGYFPRVLEEYLALKDAKTSPIVFKEADSLTADKNLLRSEIGQKLAETVL